MRHRNSGPQDHDHGQRPDPRYRDMPSVSNGPLRNSGNASGSQTFGYPGQSGHDVFSHDDDYQRGQGGYGQDQGRHAQSGHGRGAPRDRGGSSQSRGTGGGHRGRGPRNYRRSDESITDELIDRFTDHPALDARQILLQVEGGEVTLTGEVPERRMKHLAEDIAAELHGITELHNRIRVDDGRSWLGPPGKAVRSGNDGGEAQTGSGFSSSERLRDPLGVDDRTESSNEGRGPSS